MTIVVLMVSALLVAIDQLLKSWVVGSLAGGPSVMLIPGLLQLTYVENRGPRSAFCKEESAFSQS